MALIRQCPVLQMYEIHKKVLGVHMEDGKGWADLCVKVPVVNLEEMFSPTKRRRRREVDDFGEEEEDAFAAIRAGDGLGAEAAWADPAVVLYPDDYCQVVRSLPLECYEVR